LFHAFAILGHVGHLMFLPAGLYLVRDRRRCLRYVAVLGATTAAAYAFCGIVWMRPRSFEELRVWLLGSSVLTLDRSFSWHGGYSLPGLKLWLNLSRTILGGGPIAGTLLAALAAAGAAASWRSRPRPTRACLLWLAGYAVLYLSWEPGTFVYRITDLLPVWLLILAAFEALPWRPSWKNIGLAAIVAALGLNNLFTDALPNGDPLRNASLQRALWLGRTTPEGAWIVVDNNDQVYVPYFAHRNPLNLRYYTARKELLRTRLNELGAQGAPVFVVPETLSPEWREWFAAQRLEGKGRFQGWSLSQVRAAVEGSARPIVRRKGN